mmetsp:Transcript_4337/g.12431  ORF Transcript_4337/g.12431 Transcript_4337/m.12431 type:complete len:252 (+) Transcript_4337:570-1325(+)
MAPNPVPVPPPDERPDHAVPDRHADANLPGGPRLQRGRPDRRELDRPQAVLLRQSRRRRPRWTQTHANRHLLHHQRVRELRRNRLRHHRKDGGRQLAMRRCLVLVRHLRLLLWLPQAQHRRQVQVRQAQPQAHVPRVRLPQAGVRILHERKRRGRQVPLDLRRSRQRVGHEVLCRCRVLQLHRRARDPLPDRQRHLRQRGPVPQHGPDLQSRPHHARIHRLRDRDEPPVPVPQATGARRTPHGHVLFQLGL